MDLVRFYACAGDTMAVAAKLVRKAQERGELMCVCGDADSLQRLSARLWHAPGFLAHAVPSASEAVRRHSRVRLCDMPPPDAVVDVVLNLGAELHFNGFHAKRLLDVFGPAEEERRAARVRYRRCQAAGWPTETVQVGGA